MKADYIFVNGEIHTVDQEDSIVSSLAVKDDKIIAAGEAEVLKYQDENTKVIDLAGKSAVPGFIDAHLHMAVLGMNLMSIDCRYPHVKSIEDIQEKIREKAKHSPKGTWIRGWGYDQSKLKEKRHPTKWDLDQAADEHPVVLTRTCAHISVHNSRSLEVAGIGDTAESTEGGVIDKVNGHVSGIMKENAHMEILAYSLPSREELREALKTAQDLLISQGVTGLHDSGGYGPVQMALMNEMTMHNELKVDIYNMLFSFNHNLDFINSYLSKGKKAAEEETMLKLGPIKIMIDGSSSGPTAATLEPYTSDPDNYGIMSMGQEAIEEVVMKAHSAGFQVTCHAVGDRAVTAIIDAIEKALRQNPRENHRHRIEHCGMVDETLLKRIKDLNIIPVAQPIFLYEFGDGYLVNYGVSRTDRMFACKSFFDAGIICAGSSDSPITDSNPIHGIHLAVNRITQSGKKISQKQRISKQQALRMYTYNSAYAAFEEEQKGSLEVGKKANIVILSDSFNDCPEEKLKDLKVEGTMINGRFVYCQSID